MARSSPPYHPVSDPHDSRLNIFRSLKGKALEREGVFIGEGEKVVRAMVEARIPLVSCLVSREAMPRYHRLLASLAKGAATVYAAPGAIVDEIIGFRFHRGIMAVGRCPAKRSILEGLTPKRHGRRRLFVALDGVNDPQNVGLIARSAAAFGAGALIVDRASYDPYYRKAVRVSMGAVFRLPVHYEEDLAASLRHLRRTDDVRILAAVPSGRARSIERADLSDDVLFVFGNEDVGVSPAVARISDGKIRIPIVKDVDSLNVAAAAAICLYEASRERQ